MLVVQRKVRAIYRGNPQTVGEEPPRMSAPEREWVVRAARRDTGVSFLDRPRDLAVALDITVGAASVRDFEGEVTIGRTVFIRAKCDSLQGSLFLLHGIGHILLRDAGAGHNESDVWLLTGELVLPARRIFDAATLTRLHAPGWFLTEWMRTRGTIRREVVRLPDVAFP